MLRVIIEILGEEMMASSKVAELFNIAITFNDHYESLPKNLKVCSCLVQFLTQTSLGSGNHNNNDVSSPQSAVAICTMHTSKGLEWEVVFIPDCEENIIPHRSNANSEEERRLLYVASTRAMSRLFISFVSHFLYGTKNYHLLLFAIYYLYRLHPCCKSRKGAETGLLYCFTPTVVKKG
ncbi:uncharacterized protein LOC135121650 [Zophobas morio]|uniref:uncharacterized protein LOC135121650 n=1 Tax=Zophobas morio TaxID=2755281 RepID=UPI003082CE95